MTRLKCWYTRCKESTIRALDRHETTYTAVLSAIELLSQLIKLLPMPHWSNGLHNSFVKSNRKSLMGMVQIYANCTSPPALESWYWRKCRLTGEKKFNLSFTFPWDKVPQGSRVCVFKLKWTKLIGRNRDFSREIIYKILNRSNFLWIKQNFRYLSF